jgi:hypothetical membrane protein
VTSRPGPERRAKELTSVERALAIGGIVGPVAFVSAWVLGGLFTDGYSPIDEAISELAASGADTQLLMTAGLVIFGIGVAGYAVALRRALPGDAWIAALVCAVATLGVAATPLRFFDSDVAHGVFALVGYVAIASIPILAAPMFAARGRSSWAATSWFAGGLAAVCLLLTATDWSSGFFQRAGLAVGDAWIVATAVALVVEGRLFATDD